MAPTAAGVDITQLPHTAQAGVVDGSEPAKFYPFCSANDFSKPLSVFETAKEAVEDADMRKHIAQHV